MMLLTILILFSVYSAPAFELEIICEKNEGVVFVAVYDKEEDFMENRVHEAMQKVEEGKAIIQLDLDPGEYAISIFQDLNGNGDLDTGFMGIPSEPYGFSNNARGRFGPPTYEDCKFDSRQMSKMTIYLK